MIRLYTQPRTDDEKDKADEGLLEKQDARKRKIKAKGIDYEFEGHVSDKMLGWFGLTSFAHRHESYGDIMTEWLLNGVSIFLDVNTAIGYANKQCTMSLSKSQFCMTRAEVHRLHRVVQRSAVPIPKPLLRSRQQKAED